MSAALVPTFTRAVAEGGTATGLAPGFQRHQSPSDHLRGRSPSWVSCSPNSWSTSTQPASDRCLARLELTLSLTRIMFPFLVDGDGGRRCLMAMLNALHRFFIPALSPAMFNVATILCAVIFVPLSSRFGVEPIVAIAVGTLLGGLGQIALQWPAARREGFRYRPRFWTERSMAERNRPIDGARRGRSGGGADQSPHQQLARHGARNRRRLVARLRVPPDVHADRSVRHLDRNGGVAWNRRATRQATTRVGVRQDVSRGLRMMLMLNIPATVGLVVLATPIVALIFERGRFTPADTAATAAALACYAPGLVGYSVVKLISPAFYALREQSRTGHCQRSERRIQHSAEPSCSSGRWATEDWHWAQRWPHCSMAHCFCGCCARDWAVSTGSGVAHIECQRFLWRPSPWRSRRTTLSVSSTSRSGATPSSRRGFVYSERSGSAWPCLA